MDSLIVFGFFFFSFISFYFLLHEVEKNTVLPFSTRLNRVGGGVQGKPTQRIQVIRANTGPCTWEALSPVQMPIFSEATERIGVPFFAATIWR